MYAREFLYRNLIPTASYRLDSEGVHRYVFDGESWNRQDASSRGGLLRREILLVPEDLLLFRFRDFPADELGESDLAEAVELDVASWSPWEVGTESYYLPRRVGGKWRVAIWIWQLEELRRRIGIESPHFTHVIPETAWHLFAAKLPTLPAVIIDSEDGESGHCALLGSGGELQRLRYVRTTEAGEQFLQDVTSDNNGVPVLRSRRAAGLSGNLVEMATGEVESSGLPAASVLSRARMPDFRDWTDGFVWARPLGILFGLYLIWLAGSGVVLLQKSEAISREVEEARADANDVIELRDRVRHAHAQLERIRNLRGEQTRFEWALARIVAVMPDESRIDALQYDSVDGGWMSIDGATPQSARLAADLESLPFVADANFVSDIRRNEATGLETFRLRLKLAEMPATAKAITSPP